MWVSARSDDSCACMCSRGCGNALFEHVARSCGRHTLRGCKVAQVLALLSLSSVPGRGSGSRGHALTVGLSHCDYFLAIRWRWPVNGMAEYRHDAKAIGQFGADTGAPSPLSRQHPPCRGRPHRAVQFAFYHRYQRRGELRLRGGLRRWCRSWR
jgi:hypothetical protein